MNFKTVAYSDLSVSGRRRRGKNESRMGGNLSIYCLDIKPHLTLNLRMILAMNFQISIHLLCHVIYLNALKFIALHRHCGREIDFIDTYL